MLNETYSVRKISITRAELEVAIQEYIMEHNIPPTVFPENRVTFTYKFISDGMEGLTELSGITVKLVFNGQPEGEAT